MEQTQNQSGMRQTQYQGPERRQAQPAHPYNGPERRKLDWPFPSLQDRKEEQEERAREQQREQGERT